MAKTQSRVLVSNASATGAWFRSLGNGWHVFDVEATWSGTVKLEVKGPNDGALDPPSASFTANGRVPVWLQDDDEVRANILTATAVYASIKYAKEGN